MSPDPDAPDDTAPPAVLRVCCLGGDELVELLGDGSALADAVADRGADRPQIEVTSVPAADLDALLADTAAWAPALEGAHVVLRSISPDVRSDVAVAELGATFQERMAELVAILKAAGATVIALNGSTVDPDDAVFSYRGLVSSPALAVHQLDLELIRISMLDGISIVDVDRLVAERGGADTVPELLRFDASVADAITRELATILEEYGWFDDRPILQQRGQRPAA